jgi:5'-3' exonuclease
MILIDYSGIAIGNIVTQRLAMDENLIRHMILNSIRMYRTKYGKEYGEIVVVADGGNNWRRDFYPEYKANRKTGREESTLDWGEIFRILNMVLDEIRENFPYKVMRVDKCEADDIIAHIALETQEFGKFEKVMIISADKDFKQLHKYSNIKQYSPMLKKLITESNPRTFLMEHLLKGDTSDGVPNVLNDDKVFIEGRRQKPLSKKKIEAWIASEDLRADMGEEVYRNFMRNKKMIDLTETPEPIKQEIINNYEAQDPSNNKGKVFPYLIAKRCKLLLENVQEFI